MEQAVRLVTDWLEMYGYSERDLTLCNIDTTQMRLTLTFSIKFWGVLSTGSDWIFENPGLHLGGSLCNLLENGVKGVIAKVDHKFCRMVFRFNDL
jgi:hypothetical protein